MEEGSLDPMASWSNEMCQEFMEVYEKYPVLWQITHKDKKNRHALANAWSELQKEFGVDVPLDILKRKKESIMATYRCLRRRIKQEKQKGNSYEPNWYLFPTVHRIMKKAHSNSDVFDELHDNLEEETYADEVDGECWVSIDEDGHKLKLPGTVLEVDGSIQRDESSSHPLGLELQFMSKRNSGNRNPKRSRRRSQSRSRKRANLVFETDDANDDTEPYVTPEQLISQSSTAETFDTCSMYCQLLAEKLRMMSSRHRMIVQNKIDNIVFKALMEELDPPCSQQQSSAKGSDFAGSRQKETSDLDLDPLAIESSVSKKEDQNESTTQNTRPNSDISDGEF